MKPSMVFENTGLPKSESIKDAYEYALKIHVNRFDEELKLAYRALEQRIQQQFEQMKMSGQYNDVQLKDLKNQLDAQARMMKSQVEKQMLENRDADFLTRNIEPAKILGETDAENEDTIKAIILLETLRSPKDYDRIREKFGKNVSDIIADVLDYEAYPSEQENKLKTMSDNSKLANLALIVGSAKTFVTIGKTLPQGQKMPLVGGTESAKVKIKFASAVRGLNSKLDEVFVNIFNELTKYVDTGVRVEVDDNNKLKAVPIKNNPPSGPAGKGVGGDFFGNDNKNPPSGSFGGPKIGGGF